MSGSQLGIANDRLLFHFGFVIQIAGDDFYLRYEELD